MVKIIKKVSGVKVDYEIIDYPSSYPADEPSRRLPDISKARDHFDFIPKVDLENGLQRFLNWTSKIYTGEE